MDSHVAFAVASEYPEIARRELKDALGLAVGVNLLLAASALVVFFGWQGPVYLPSVGGALLLGTIFARVIVGRMQPSGGWLYLWRGVLLAACLVHSGLWLFYLQHPGAGPYPHFALGTLFAVAAAMPLLYWWPGLLLLLVLGSAWVYSLSPAQTPLVMWLGMGIGVLLLVGLVFLRFLVQQRRERRLDLRRARALEDYELRCMDVEEQLLYERERMQACRKELVEVRELAEEAGRIKTEFLATISHEIRTPLNGILPILEMLQGTSLNEEQQRFVRAATSSSRHLLRIINDILDFARAESGKLQLESIELNLKDLAQSVLDLMAGSAKRKELKLKLHIDPDVPVAVRGDPVRLRQVMANLLSNAIKFTEQGGVELSIEQTRAGRREVELRFAITDTGIGLSPEEAKGLFSSFSQADASTTRKHGGTGMGLAICRRLVELMGGRIGVHSVGGQGSTFWFALPMRRSLQEVPTTRTSLAGLRLLTAVADDELASRLSDDLRQWGVHEERTPPDNLAPVLHDTAALGKSWSFDGVLLDVWGSEQDLVDSLREIRADFLLKSMNIVVICGSQELGRRLHKEFSAYVISEGHQSEPLRRLLYRLFDVASSTTPEVAQDTLAGYLDLNLDQESVLVSNAEAEEAVDEKGVRRPRVLLAEDNPVNLGVVQRVLKRLGAQCLVAANGERALEILMQGADVDMVLMDCQMPVMDGYEATRAWRKHERRTGGHIPIVAMTAYVMPGDREKCFDAGMDDYLAKPVSIEELSQVLGKWSGAVKEVSPTRMPELNLQQPEGHEQRMLDRSIVVELREVMEDGFGELVETYLNSSPELMDALQKAVDTEDVEAMAAPAHSLKSSSANMGATKLSSLARAVESAARERDMKKALAAYRKMPTVYLATCAALRFELGRE